MVYFFTSVTTAGSFSLYMGRDKTENEDLIRYGWEEDVWFHVDDLSSAHVYLRMAPGITIDTIPKDLLEDCAQLVKANSIEGNKKSTGKVKIVYTMWSNLHKSSDMAVGQVGFHSQRALHYTEVDKKDNAIVNRLNKTRTELPTSSIKQSREQRDEELRAKEKKQKREAAEQEKKLIEERKKEKEARSYDNVFTPEHMTSNAEINIAGKQFEDDFM